MTDTTSLTVLHGQRGTVTGQQVLEEIAALLAERLACVEPSDPAYPHLHRMAHALGVLVPVLRLADPDR